MTMKNAGILITPVAIILLLLGSLVLDNTLLTIGGALLLIVGIVLMPRSPGIGGYMMPIAVLIAAGLVILLRSIR